MKRSGTQGCRAAGLSLDFTQIMVLCLSLWKRHFILLAAGFLTTHRMLRARHEVMQVQCSPCPMRSQEHRRTSSSLSRVAAKPTGRLLLSEQVWALIPISGGPWPNHCLSWGLNSQSSSMDSLAGGPCSESLGDMPRLGFLSQEACSISRGCCGHGTPTIISFSPWMCPRDAGFCGFWLLALVSNLITTVSKGPDMSSTGVWVVSMRSTSPPAVQG